MIVATTETPVAMTTTTTEIKFHPAAAVFPLLEEEPFEALVADIQAHGLREPITLHPDGSVLDGRNRYRACLAASVEPRFDTWNEQGDALAFVLSLNLHRRHLDASQRCMVAARIANMRQGARTDLAQICAMSQTQAAEQLNVSRRGVQSAVEVLGSGDADLIAAVDQGEIGVGLAAKEVHARINEPRNARRRSKAALREVAKRAEREDHGPSITDFGSNRSASTTEEGDREPDWEKLRERLHRHTDAIMAMLKEVKDEGWYECVRDELLSRAQLIARREFDHG